VRYFILHRHHTERNLSDSAAKSDTVNSVPVKKRKGAQR
jgi:hypothetical protein